MKYFNNINTLDELKKEYRRLVMIHHPDRGGNLETMKAINLEYEQRHEALKNAWNATHDDEHKCTETPEEFREILEKLLKLDGLEIELCGCWLWIGGNTREHKEELKAAGCRWSNNKKMWYWHHIEEGSKWHRGKRTMSEIRTKYGSQVFTADGETTGYARIGATA
jgi:hypothetical protein